MNEVIKESSTLRQQRKVRGGNRIVSDHLPGFARKFGAMLGSGMPMLDVLNSLQKQTAHPGFKSIIMEIRMTVESGSSLSEALMQYPLIFSELFVNIARSGEASGSLPEALNRLADALESSMKIRKKVRSAMIYPSIVLFVAFISTFLLITFVVPVFAQLFESNDSKLPAPTQFLMDLSELIQSQLYVIIPAFIVLIVIYRIWKSTPEGMYMYDKIQLSLPVVGGLHRKVASARFARTFAQLLRSGVHLPEALKISAGAVGNKCIQRFVDSTVSIVEGGQQLSVALQGKNVFPATLVEMLQAGENSGKIDEMMDNVADYYENEVELLVAGLSALLQPLLIIFIGIVVGGVLVCMFLPIFKLPGVLG